jgi:hypothetical protein
MTSLTSDGSGKYYSNNSATLLLSRSKADLMIAIMAAVAIALGSIPILEPIADFYVMDENCDLHNVFFLPMA